MKPFAYGCLSHAKHVNTRHACRHGFQHGELATTDQSSFSRTSHLAPRTSHQRQRLGLPRGTSTRLGLGRRLLCCTYTLITQGAVRKPQALPGRPQAHCGGAEAQLRIGPELLGLHVVQGKQSEPSEPFSSFHLCPSPSSTPGREALHSSSPSPSSSSSSSCIFSIFDTTEHPICSHCAPHAPSATIPSSSSSSSSRPPP